MATQYTILKLLIQTSSKARNSNKGFTLLELLFGLLIMGIVFATAMNAFVEASATFSRDKKNIDSNQNLSAILELIGNDIRQSGEQIKDPFFPAMEFSVVPAADPNLMPGSSKVTIRRAVTTPLTLCQNIPTATVASTLTALTVADNTPATIAAAGSCDVGTVATQLFARRPGTTYTLTPVVPVPSPALALILPRALRDARDYRCKLDNLNPAVPYESPANATTDFCVASPLETVRIAVSDGGGHILIFNQTNETDDTAGAVRKYGITINSTGLDADTVANNTRNQAAPGGYPIGSPIYLLEERTYTLDNLGNFRVSINGGAPNTLINKIQNFSVSAKGYTNATDRIVDPTPGVPPISDLPVQPADICAGAPTTPTVDDPQYICKFNNNALVGDLPVNWRMIAGVRVQLQARYDPTGGSPTPSAAQTARLSAVAEYFPRNVLSK
jgi:prepilin-type N-terminal cleavage/methylation domain-containing protein